MDRSGASRRFGVAFTSALVLSWAPVTVIVGLAIWRDGVATGPSASWVSLWVFTVLAPTLNAFTIHRSLARLWANGVDVAAVDELARLPALLLIYGDMALISAFALMYGR